MLKSKLFKKLTSLSMATLMAVTALTGCSQGKEEAKPSTDTTTNTQEAGKESTEVPKLVIAMQANPNVIDYEDNYLTKLVEEKMNVDLEFLLLPSDSNDAKTKISLMVSSGSKLPDVFNLQFDDLTYTEFANKGILQDVTALYDDPSVAANYAKLPEDVKDLAFNSLNVDGKMYGLFKYGPSGWNSGSFRTYINQEWLAKLNLEVPTTTDELYEVLKAFATQDPNGNGKKDEIPMMGSKDGWGENPMVFLMNAFLPTNPDKDYLMVENGKIIPAYTQDAFKEGLTYVNKLVSENLLSPVSFTQDATQFKALAGSEVAMVGVVPAGSGSTFAYPMEKGEVNRMQLMAPIAGPEGVATTPYNPGMPVNGWNITKDCENAELAFKVGDLFFDPEMQLIGRYGEKDVNWSNDPEVLALYESKFASLGYETTLYENEENKIWNTPQQVTWMNVNPGYMPAEIERGMAWNRKDLPESEKRTSLVPLFEKLYVPTFPEEYITVLRYTDEEVKQLSVMQTTINEYVKTKMVEFATGNSSLNDWDKYLKELENMGLNQYISIVQAAYDRSK